MPAKSSYSRKTQKPTRLDAPAGTLKLLVICAGCLGAARDSLKQQMLTNNFQASKDSRWDQEVYMFFVVFLTPFSDTQKQSKTYSPFMFISIYNLIF